MKIGFTFKANSILYLSKVDFLNFSLIFLNFLTEIHYISINCCYSEMSPMTKLICLLFVSCLVTCISAQCWTVNSEGPSPYPYWCDGPDGISGTADDSSCFTDMYVLNKLYPTQCPPFGCKIVSFQIQWFNQLWSPLYYPCIDDFNTPGFCNFRMWAYFQDHNHSYTYCAFNMYTFINN